MSTIGFFQAASYVRRGSQLVRVPGLRRFVWIPLAINVLVFAGLGWFLYGVLGDWMAELIPFDRFRDIWLIAKLESVLRFVLGFIVGLVLAYAFTLLANLIGAPFNSLLAEQVQAHLTGIRPGTEPGVLVLLQSVPKTLWSEISKLFYLGLWLIPLLIAHLIPGLNLIAPFLLFLFGAWMFALEYIDYPMGNHGHGFKAVRKSLRKRRGMAIGFGSVVAVISSIPIVNLFIMPVAVAGATALYVEHIDE